MIKYHINNKGKPAICNAKKGQCPFGNSDNHYDSQQEAQNAIDKKNEITYSLLPNAEMGTSNEYFRNATKLDNEYIIERKEFLKHETSAPTYITKCKYCRRIKDPSFYMKSKNKETYHFDKERKGRVKKLNAIYNEEDTVGFYEVNHKIKGKYITQVIEVTSTGKLIVYDKDRGCKVTSFMAHRARIETMMILANEIPTMELMNTISSNHKKDLKRQKIDRKFGLA